MLKTFAIAAAALSLIAIGTLFAIAAGARAKKQDIEALCTTASGTQVDGLIATARRLGFSEKEQGALPSGIQVFGSSPKMSDPLQWRDDSLPGIESGKIVFGKVLFPPFSRGYCQIDFERRSVTSTKLVWLD